MKEAHLFGASFFCFLLRIKTHAVVADFLSAVFAAEVCECWPESQSIRRIPSGKIATTPCSEAITSESTTLPPQVSIETHPMLTMA